MIKVATQKTIMRWVHLVLAIPIIGYVYSPFEELPNYAPMVRYVFLPAIALAGLWLWKGHAVQRVFARRTA